MLAPLLLLMHFEPNVGQAPPEVRWIARAPGGNVLFDRDGAVFTAGRARIRMRLNGGRSGEFAPADRLSGSVSYFLGGDPSRWRAGVSRYGRLARRGVYEGIDLVFHARETGLEYDFEVAPGADPDAIRLAFEGASARVGDDGDLVLRAGGEEVRHRRPRVYQDGAEIAASFAMERGEVRIAIADYDRSKPLTVDPVVVFSTYLGGAREDAIRRIAVDALGNAYVTGSTTSANFPVANAFRSTIATANTADVFVSKFSPTGTLLYSTYVGGGFFDEARAISVDANGAAYVAGETSSTDFPVVGAAQSINRGGTDAFFLKLSPAGNALSFSSYFGGDGYDGAFGIGTDGTGNVYVAGNSTSSNLSLLNPFQTRRALHDGFVAKLPASGSPALYSTYLGGTGNDYVRGLAVDASGAAHVFGETDSTDFPVANALQAANAGSTDLFFTRVAPQGAGPVTLSYSTYLGGTDTEIAGGVYRDAAGALYAAASTWSVNFPLSNPYRTRPANSPGPDAVALKLAPGGGQLIFSTFLNDQPVSEASGIAADGAGNVFVTGRTVGAWPLIDPVAGLPPFSPGGEDAFLMKLVPAGNNAALSTPIGGARADFGTDVATDSSGAVWVAGHTASKDLPPIVNGLAKPLTNSGTTEGFLMKIDPAVAAPLTILAPGPGETIGVAGVTISWQPVTGATGYNVRIYADAATYFLGSVPGGVSSLLVNLPNGDFTVAVACAGPGAVCPYSFRRFRVRQSAPSGVPSIVFPAGVPVLETSTHALRWTPVAATGSYEVQVINLTLNVTELQIRVQAPDVSTIYSFRGADYQMRVRACAAGCGAWSEPVIFTVDLPPVSTAAPTISTASASGNQVTLAWNAVPGADLYLVQLVQPSGGPGGGPLTVASTRVSTASVNLTAPAGPLFAFVAGCNGDGCKANSAPAAVTVPGPNSAAPVVGTPASGDAINGPVVLISWNRVAGDDGNNTTYRLYVQDMGRQSAALDVLTKANFYGAYFSPGTRYDIVVIANPGPSQVQGPASGFSVRGTAPRHATLVNPTHTSTQKAGSVTLGWTPLLDTNIYQFFIGGFSGVTSGTRVDLQLTPGTYIGAVRACAPNAVCDPSSDTGWLPWSNAPGGSGVVTFTVVP